MDDIILTGNDTEYLKERTLSLNACFTLKDLGDLSYFLGIQILRDVDSIHLNQCKYIVELLSRSGLTDSKRARTPMQIGITLSKLDGHLLDDATEYISLVGAF